MTRFLCSLAAVSLATLAASDVAHAQVTFTPAPSQPVYSGQVVGQPVYTYPYSYAPTTTYRTSQYVAPGTTYVAPARPSYYTYPGRYTTSPYGYAPGYSPYYGQPVSPYTQQGYVYPNNNAVNLTIPGLGNIGIGRR